MRHASCNVAVTKLEQTHVKQCLLLGQNWTNGVFGNFGLHSNLNSNEQLQVTHRNDSIVAQMALVGPGLNPMQEPWSQLGYLHHSSTLDDVKGVTHWVVADFDSQVYLSPHFRFFFCLLCQKRYT